MDGDSGESAKGEDVTWAGKGKSETGRGSRMYKHV